MIKSAEKVIGIRCPYDASLIEIPFEENTVVKPGDEVIFKDEDGKEEYGVIAYANTNPRNETVLASSKILRKATPNDTQKVQNFSEQAEDSLTACKTYVDKHGLNMQPFFAGYSFDGNKMYFMFTADERVDFRELVKDLAKNFQKQIHLRQIGPRDKAKMVGGYGRCGRQLCCTSFLGKLESINMEMVRVQGLESKGSSKLSGACGKLLCCLKYEVQQYREFRKTMPRIGDRVRLKKSSIHSGKEAQIIGLDVLNQKLKIIMVEGEFAIVSLEEVDKVLKSGPPDREEALETEGVILKK